MVLVAALAGCGHGGRAAPASASRGGPLPALLSMVPADAGLVVHVAPGLVERLPDLAATSFRQGMAASPGDDDGPLERALLAEILQPGPIGPRLGWRAGQSELVMWAEGKRVSVRARIDGAALRATIERAEAASGHKVPRKVWQGQPYLSWAGDEGQTMLARIGDDDAAMISSTDPEHDLPLLFSTTPAARPFDPSPVVTALFPGRADGRFGMHFDPSWATIVGGDAFMAEVDDPRCARAAMQWLGRLPPIDYAWASDGETTELAASLRIAPATASRLAQEIGPIPHWTAAEDHMAMGFGASPAAVLDAILPAAADLEDTLGRCGRPVELVDALRQLAAMPILTEVRGGSLIGDVRTNAFALAVRPSDVGRLWAGLRALAPFPLRPQPPARGERFMLPGVVITSDGTSLLAAQDDEASRALLADLTAAGDGPTVLAALAMGDGVISTLVAKDHDDAEEAENARLFWSWFSGLALELALRDERLISRVILRHR